LGVAPGVADCEHGARRDARKACDDRVMKDPRGVIVHLHDDDVGGSLERNARELIRRTTDGRVKDDALARTRQGRLAKALQLSQGDPGIGASPGVGRPQRLEDEMPERLRLDDMNDVELRVVYGSHQIARPSENVRADVAQVDADDDHHMTPTFAFSCFDHGDS
jgi:hypothetical protein